MENATKVIEITGLFAVTCISLFLASRFCIGKHGFPREKLKSLNVFFEKRALLILLIFVILDLLWLGLVIFKNPYLSYYNQGNGAYFVQMLHNLVHGIGPEETVKASGSLYYSSNNYYFTSVFSVLPEQLPMLVLAPLYWIYPFPPMHIFSLALVVVGAGSFGIYLAVRSLNGSRILSLFASIGYCLLPWVNLSIFNLGFFDNMGFAVYPYVFATLFSKRWKLFYLSVFILALISPAYAYSVIALCFIVALLFESRKQGLIVFLIGLSVVLWDMGIVRASLCNLNGPGTEPLNFAGVLNQGVSDRTFIQPIKFHLVYLFALLATVSFLPMFALQKDGKWNWPVIGLLFFALTGAFMGLFRSYSWDGRRNSNMVVPIYLCAFISYINWAEVGEDRVNKIFSFMKKNIGCVFMSTMISAIIWFNWNYPWNTIIDIFKSRYSTDAKIKIKSPANVFITSEYNRQMRIVLEIIEENIPKDASVAFRVDAGLEAFVANRQKTWPLGYHPEGVEYYIIQTLPVNTITEDFPNWQKHLEKIQKSEKYKLLYNDDKLLIYKNLYPEVIPRLESVLGWDVLLKGLLPFRCKNNPLVSNGA